MTRTRGVNRSRPSGGFEVVAWMFMRVSGILMFLFLLGHIAYMHIISNVDDINYDFVAKRYASPFWRVYDLLLLTLVLFHGLNGARTVIHDYVHPRGWRVFVISVLYVTALVFFVIGSYTILAFRPVTS